MNSLSWLIYLSQLVENISAVCIAILIFGGTISGLTTLFSHLEHGRPYPWAKKTFIWILSTAIPILVIIPSQKTVIMIAASQYGEMFVKSPQVSQIVDPSLEYLKTFLESEVKKLKERK